MINTIGWIGNGCFILGAILLAQKKIFGWTYQILGNLAYIIQGYFLGVSSLWALSVILIITNIYGIYQWKKSNVSRYK